MTLVGDSVYEQILCLPLCKNQTVPTSPLTLTAPERVRSNTLKTIVKALRATTKNDYVLTFCETNIKK